MTMLAIIQVLELVAMCTCHKEWRDQNPIQYTTRKLILACVEIGIVSIVWTFDAMEVDLVSKFSDFTDLFVETADRAQQLLCLNLLRHLIKGHLDTFRMVEMNEDLGFANEGFTVDVVLVAFELDAGLPLSLAGVPRTTYHVMEDALDHCR